MAVPTATIATIMVREVTCSRAQRCPPPCRSGAVSMRYAAHMHTGVSTIQLISQNRLNGRPSIIGSMRSQNETEKHMATKGISAKSNAARAGLLHEPDRRACSLEVGGGRNPPVCAACRGDVLRPAVIERRRELLRQQRRDEARPAGALGELRARGRARSACGCVSSSSRVPAIVFPATSMVGSMQAGSPPSAFDTQAG